MFISMQNTRSTLSWVEIFQRYYILIILLCLRIPGHAHQKWKHQYIKGFDAHLHKNSTSCPTSFLRYHKDFANLLFWVIWAHLAIPTKISRIANSQQKRVFGLCKLSTLELFCENSWWLLAINYFGRKLNVRFFTRFNIHPWSSHWRCSIKKVF